MFERINRQSVYNDETNPIDCQQDNQYRNDQEQQDFQQNREELRQDDNLDVHYHRLLPSTIEGNDAIQVIYRKEVDRLFRKSIDCYRVNRLIDEHSHEYRSR
jgi:hypothetical protein